MKKIIIILLILLLVGCTSAVQSNIEFIQTTQLGYLEIRYDEFQTTTMGVISFVDQNNNNICYVAAAYKKGGISCVSLT